MIPSVLAHEVRSTLLDYLRTTFALSDAELEARLFAFLEGPRGIFRGPYVDLRLPFVEAEPGETVPLDIRPPFRPHHHQINAFLRLTSKDGHQPQHTLVTTGTGSGKTECFLYPILDHCARHAGTPGVRAILVYPMNALASDQAKRIAGEIWRNPLLKGRVRAGLFIGGEARRETAGPEHLVDDKNTLRREPPDILLTNYKMLDFLLLRPQDQALWAHNTPETLRYVVLDELHTYDGARGSDVACLLRRLRARLQIPPHVLTCVGTSATIGAKGHARTKRDLAHFASQLFGVRFDSNALIEELRKDPDEVLSACFDWVPSDPSAAARASTEPVSRVPLPSEVQDLDPDRFEGPSAFIERQLALWFERPPATPVALGEALRSHRFLKTLLSVIDGPTELSELAERVTRDVPGFAALNAEARRLALSSFLALVAHARRQKPDPDGREEPFLYCQVQLWVRELRRLLRRLPSDAESDAPEFMWGDEVKPDRTSAHYLPLIFCRECGGSGFATAQREGDTELSTASSTIAEAHLHRSPAARYLIVGRAPDPEVMSERLCTKCLRVGKEDRCTCGTSTFPAGLTGSVTSDDGKRRFQELCPECGARGELQFLASRAPTLLSAAITQLFQSSFNEDKKLLAFTDSVQDASHRAGFFGARTYRFNLRTAIQRAVEASPAPPSLAELSKRILTEAERELSKPELIATLMPPDLIQLEEYRAYRANPNERETQAMLRVLEERLAFEVVLEYGMNTHTGRTLERTLCSTAAPRADRLAEAARRLTLDLAEKRPFDSDGRPPESAVRLFLEGLVHRMRSRGAVLHPFFEPYITAEGSGRALTRQQVRLISPFPADARRPRFLSGAKSHNVFDTFTGAASILTWARDWASRALGVAPRDEGVRELYRLALLRLVQLRVADEREGRTGKVWGLLPDGLEVVRDVEALACDHCARSVALPSEARSRWRGAPCLRFRCPGRLTEPTRTRASYYARIYRSGRLERIYAAEHSSLLSRKNREALEKSFTQTSPEKPDAPNLLVCTPTLEMGIDIGDLSAAALCSVPPSPSNYLQRVGRAGRKTGNAFILALATAQPHDLYFQANPREMLAGEVLPPGCFLDAPYMLNRQLVAFAMDRFARTAPSNDLIPGQVGHLLGKKSKDAFPEPFLAYYRKNRTALTEAFLRCFEADEVSAENREKVRRFGESEDVEAAVRGAFERVRREREEYHQAVRGLKARAQVIQRDPSAVADAETELAEIEETTRLLGGWIRELGEKYPLNVLTDEGVLPNYSFPEPGVALKSVLKKAGPETQEPKPRRGKPRAPSKYEVREYLRPASSAIRELAPFNTFYAEGHRVRIQEIDLGGPTHALVETWRLCPSCHHMAKTALDTVPAATCVACGHPGWADAGQRRTLVSFRRAISIADALASVTVDRDDDRDRKRYQVVDLIHVEKEHRRGAQQIPEICFGVEFLRELPLRQINFGPMMTEGSSFEVAGHKVQEEGFVTCESCGRVRDGSRPEDEAITHAPYCRVRRGTASERLRSMFLYRELESEAIRILLPVAGEKIEETRASFKAAVELGLRRRFRGRPSHLHIAFASEPTDSERARRNFLYLFDAVPGGTGYLASLWNTEKGAPGSGMLGILERALEAMRGCECGRTQPPRDGCFRCLLAFQQPTDLPKISKSFAMERIAEILGKREALQEIHTLSEVEVEDRLESELEQRFIDKLREHARRTPQADWAETFRGGERAWLLSMPSGCRWLIVPQVDLGPVQGVELRCRPDFLFQPLGSFETGTKPIAVFLDGFEYHGRPGKPDGRIEDDIAKRSAILASDRYRVWSLAWWDLDPENKPDGKKLEPLFSGLPPLHGMFRDLSLKPEIAQRRSFELLLEYLDKPDEAEWTKATGRLTAGLLAGEQPEEKAFELLEKRALRKTERFTVKALPKSPSPPKRLGQKRTLPFALLTVSGAVEDLKRNRFEQLRVILRLFDEAEMRAEEAFEGSWRSFLQAWNLLQFHRGTEVVSSELLLRRGETPVSTADLERESLAVPPAEDDVTRAQRACLEDVLDARCRELLRALFAKGLEVPAVGKDYAPHAGRVLGTIELGWPAAKVAVLLPEHEGLRAALEAEGWVVFAVTVTVEALAQALEKGTGRGA